MSDCEGLFHEYLASYRDAESSMVAKGEYSHEQVKMLYNHFKTLVTSTDDPVEKHNLVAAFHTSIYSLKDALHINLLLKNELLGKPVDEIKLEAAKRVDEDLMGRWELAKAYEPAPSEMTYINKTE